MRGGGREGGARSRACTRRTRHVARSHTRGGFGRALHAAIPPGKSADAPHQRGGREGGREGSRCGAEHAPAASAWSHPPWNGEPTPSLSSSIACCPIRERLLDGDSRTSILAGEQVGSMGIGASPSSNMRARFLHEMAAIAPLNARVRYLKSRSNPKPACTQDAQPPRVRTTTARWLCTEPQTGTRAVGKGDVERAGCDARHQPARSLARRDH